ncbi:MAG: hypothetical protein R3220_02350 [Balneolaceae bacterium]|nr:hypothetical protein [Balneolaceae bacterium]
MIKVRYASKEDVPQIVLLLEELGYTSNNKRIYDRLLDIKEQNGEVIVAINESQEILGCVHVFIDLCLAEGVTGEIVSLVVKKRCKRTGHREEIIR